MPNGISCAVRHFARLPRQDDDYALVAEDRVPDIAVSRERMRERRRRCAADLSAVLLRTRRVRREEPLDLALRVPNYARTGRSIGDGRGGENPRNGGRPQTAGGRRAPPG